MVHGIGNQDANFYKDWETELLNCVPELKGKCEIHGLDWEDARNKIQEKYPLIQQNFSSILAAFKLDNLKSLLDNASYQLVLNYVMDVLVYVGLPDMTLYLQKLGVEKLDRLAKGRESETLIIAHSLGAALMPHVIWYIYQYTAAIPYHSMMLLASPLGFSSPAPLTVAVPSMLETMGKLSNDSSRTVTLEKFAKAWTLKGPGRLNFFINQNDIVCSDAIFPFAGQDIDIIPVRQGFDGPERKALMENHPGCIHSVTFGAAQVNSLGANHDPLTYIRQDEFRAAMERLMKA